MVEQMVWMVDIFGLGGWTVWVFIYWWVGYNGILF
jgi:hypothetical protein